jgi:hypothetical protein
MPAFGRIAENRWNMYESSKNPLHRYNTAGETAATCHQIHRCPRHFDMLVQKSATSATLLMVNDLIGNMPATNRQHVVEFLPAGYSV